MILSSMILIKTTKPARINLAAETIKDDGTIKDGIRAGMKRCVCILPMGVCCVVLQLGRGAERPIEMALVRLLISSVGRAAVNR
jgi:hypothetical protein